MRHDFYYAAVISLGLHVGLASFSPGKVERIAAVKDPEKIYTPFPMPPEEKVLETSADELKEHSSTARDRVSPPSTPDVPQTPRPDSFIVPVQPPVEGIVDQRLATIPDIRGGPSDMGSRPFNLDDLDQQPMAKFQAKPIYPFEMRKNGESGEVVVDFIVDRNGEVRNAFAATSTHREFEAAAVQAVGKWKFRPGKKGGAAVSTHLRVPIVFTLTENE